MKNITKREFLKYGGATVGGLAALTSNVRLLQALETVDNPLEFYPARDWEQVYRDQYRYDSKFSFVCVPNDTHNCRLNAFVRNGVVIRTEQAYDSGNAQDLYGNKASPAWNPRGCLKGYTIARRVYGPHRQKFPTVRKGWKEWVEAGFPRDGDYQRRYFEQRGNDERLKVDWDEAFTLVAKAMVNIAETYSGEAGAKRLARQGYPKAMIDKVTGAGTQVMKLRTAVGLLGPVSKHGSLVRFANMLSLLDAFVRKVEPTAAVGARHWSTYEYLGDMDPAFPQVTGVNAFDCDMNDARETKLAVHLGKNLVEHKMADVHWMLEGMERGAKTVVITPDYNPTASKADYWIPVRPGSDAALLLGVANQILATNGHDPAFLKKFSDLPLLVRMDDLKLLRASDVLPGYKNAENSGYSAEVQQINPALRAEWGDFVVWDAKTDKPAAITREDVGAKLDAKGIDPVLEGEFTVRTVDGKSVRCRTGFHILRESLSHYTIERVSEITSTPPGSIERLAKDISTIKPFAIHSGEGVNHWYHADLKGRAAILLCTLTGNVGQFGAGPGTWAGNYKINVLDGFGVYAAEDPFNANQTPPKKRLYWRGENPVFWVYGGPTPFTGSSHMPTPTKVIWTANTNMLNNSAWLYQIVAKELPKVEMICNNDWEFTLSSEYADVAFPVPSWLETHLPDMTASCTNPFFQIWKGGIKPLYDTKMDCEIAGGVARKLGELTGDARFEEFWKYHLEGKSEWYIQRVMDASSTLKGYNCDEILKSEKAWLMNFRTYPRITGYEQINESVPFYNKTGRLEFYREEDRFIEEGENVLVHREPIEATPYLPNVIVAGPSEARRPEERGVPLSAMSADERQARNVQMTWEQAKKTENPLFAEGYRFVFISTKTRHTVHSSWAVADWNMIWRDNFGDPYRMDKRSPGAGEPNVEMNPGDGRELGIEDGDYVYVDANPADRPYVGWKPDDPLYHVARLKLRCKYNPRIRPGTVLTRHAPWGATPKSVKAHETREDGLAITEDGYQASFRYGSHESCVRMFLQPTMMSDDIVRKNAIGQGIGKGQGNDAYGVNTSYKESLVRVTKSEDGGLGGLGKWEPVRTGFTPGHENETMKRYLAGDFLAGKK